MPSWLRIATWLLLASCATFAFKKPTLFWNNTNLNDLFLLFGFVSLLVAIYKKEITVTIPRNIQIYFGIGILSLAIGTIVAYLITQKISPSFVRETIRMCAALAALFSVYFIGKADSTFPKKALIALSVSSVLLPFIFYLPWENLIFLLDASHTRFTGFLYDPNYFATVQLLPTFILFWITVARPLGKSIFISTASFLLFAYSIASIIWSGSRGGFIGIGAGIVTLIGFMFWKLPFRRASLYTGLICLGFVLSFIVMPPVARTHVTGRMNLIVLEPPTSSVIPTPNSSSTTPTINPSPQLTPVLAPILKFTARQDRLAIWESSLRSFIRNPLGYGNGYGEVANITVAGNNELRVAHNTILQILLVGGIVLFVLSTIGIIALGKAVYRSQNSFGELHYLTAALVGILVAAVFLDSLWSRWIWIMIGLILVWVTQKNKSLV